MCKYYKKYKLPFTQLYLIKWFPNKITPIHSHNGYECNILVLSGKLKESVYNNTNNDGYYEIYNKTLNKHQSSHINDKIGKHTIENLLNSNSWTLHFYSK